MRFSKVPSSPTLKLPSLQRQARQHWQDILLVVILAAMAGFVSYQGAQLINPLIFDWQNMDVWFQGDSPRVFRDMAVYSGEHFRTTVHPLFVLIVLPLVYIVKIVLSLSPIAAARVVVAAAASLWISLLFITLRLIGCRRLDTTIFSLLGAISAAAVFSFITTDTFIFGSLSILVGLCFVALTQHRKFSPWSYVVVSALTLSITVTNWMVGIHVAIVSHPWKKALLITLQAWLLVVVLVLVQKVVIPTTSARFLLFTETIQGESQHILSEESGSPLQVIKAFVFHTIVMPGIRVIDNFQYPTWPRMTVQISSPGLGSIWGIAAVMLWTALLCLGMWGLFSIRQHLRLRIVLGLTLLGQLGLHLVYGADETFIYAIHFAPLLVVLAALSTLTSARPLAVVLAGLLVVSAGLNNGLQFNQALDFFRIYAQARQEVQTQIQQRPSDPWPRGTGHVVLAAPGSQLVDKAYHEPGGSFSPAVGSFGVSLWLTDGSGLKTTSDDIPLNEIRQQLLWSEQQNIPGILTETKYYQSLWSSIRQGWKLNLKVPTPISTKQMLVIRSVGPAGGSIQSLDWDGQRLLINHRWSVKLDGSGLSKVYLGEEGPQGWMTERSTRTQWQGENGWGYARFELADGRESNLVIEDSTPPAPSLGPTVSSTQAALDLDLPDQEFAASLNAQVAHMMMGLVNGQTRPGDPTHYPSTWHRQGAYVVVALARAGYLDAAKQVSTNLAESNFLGGFGSEADAPGLTIWALSEVGMRLNQPEYDQWLWPHVHQKAQFILEMLSTDKTINRPTDGPVLPALMDNPETKLVADPARDGLIIGRMDRQQPLLFVNAVSYRGLLDAAALADRVNQPDDAKRWRGAAAQLQQAWEKAFKPPESENDRTYASSLWPTWIATSNPAPLVQGLQSRWTKLRDAQGGFSRLPLQTYFDIAEAHQWLFLNQPDRVWKTLHWFWNHQASPGLYTWWEGRGEQNTFQRWERVRGWVNPPHVTPDYWSAAEMLLLQLDMLAYTDKAASEPTIVIGAGIPATWLDKPLKVRGLSMPNAQVDWIWNGKQMDVKIRGNKVKVKLGPAFSPNTPLEIEYLD